MSSLKEQIKTLLLQEDPIGIYYPEDGNDDEYDPEVEAIFNRLTHCKTVQEIQTMLREVFMSFFDESIAGPLERYANLAQKINILKKQNH